LLVRAGGRQNLSSKSRPRKQIAAVLNSQSERWDFTAELQPQPQALLGTNAKAIVVRKKQKAADACCKVRKVSAVGVVRDAPAAPILTL
jgi:hypothetical protein